MLLSIWGRPRIAPRVGESGEEEESTDGETVDPEGLSIWKTNERDYTRPFNHSTIFTYLYFVVYHLKNHISKKKTFTTIVGEKFIQLW